MKKFALKLVAAVLGWQTRRLYKKANFRVVAVAGSMGKTSTKLAIATVLADSLRVRSQEGNYNHLVSVPLVFFAQEMPNPYNPLAWLWIFAKNSVKLMHKYPYDVVVVEVGTDGPGQIAELAAYLKVDIGVITAIAPEHMEFFENLDAVADEELSLAKYSTKLFANKDLCDSRYLKSLTIPLRTYSDAEAQALGAADTDAAKLYSLSAAVVVARELGVATGNIKEAIKKVQPPSGRLQELAGINDSTIIDDTYNASPEAVKNALKALYARKAPQKIAILGNMNELGKYSAQAHQAIGELCDPAQLDLVITIGPDANSYLAAAAESRGCRVEKFDSPYKAGEYLKDKIKPGALILAKGSQNKVFAEEAVKIILVHPHDSTKLVRQSKHWLKIKRKAFSQ